MKDNIEQKLKEVKDDSESFIKKTTSKIKSAKPSTKLVMAATAGVVVGAAGVVIYQACTKKDTPVLPAAQPVTLPRIVVMREQK